MIYNIHIHIYNKNIQKNNILLNFHASEVCFNHINCTKIRVDKKISIFNFYFAEEKKTFFHKDLLYDAR